MLRHSGNYGSHRQNREPGLLHDARQADGGVELAVRSVEAERRLEAGAVLFSDLDRETVLTLADVIGSAHKGAAERIAASLPPAPKWPL